MSQGLSDELLLHGAFRLLIMVLMLLMLQAASRRLLRTELQSSLLTTEGHEDPVRSDEDGSGCASAMGQKAEALQARATEGAVLVLLGPDGNAAEAAVQAETMVEFFLLLGYAAASILRIAEVEATEGASASLPQRLLQSLLG